MKTFFQSFFGMRGAAAELLALLGQNGIWFAPAARRSLLIGGAGAVEDALKGGHGFGK